MAAAPKLFQSAAEAKSAKAAAAACKAVKTTMVGDETSAVGLGSVKAGEPMVRGHLTRAGEACARGHGLCGPAAELAAQGHVLSRQEQDNMAKAEAKKMPAAAKSAEAAAAAACKAVKTFSTQC